MKLTINRIQDKKGSPEDGLVGHEISNEDSDKKSIEKTNNCKDCILFMKVISYLLLVLLILLVEWLGLVYFASTTVSPLRRSDRSSTYYQNRRIVYGLQRQIEYEDSNNNSMEDVSSSSMSDNTMTSTESGEVESMKHDEKTVLVPETSTTGIIGKIRQ